VGSSSYTRGGFYKLWKKPTALGTRVGSRASEMTMAAIALSECPDMPDGTANRKRAVVRQMAPVTMEGRSSCASGGLCANFRNQLVGTAQGLCVPFLLLLSNFVSTTEPHCSRGVQPGGFCAYVANREPTPGGPGSGWRRVLKRALRQLRLIYLFEKKEAAQI
jgi:hypothetical protein